MNNKFQRGKIYTIRSHLTDLIYVGSTVEPYLSTRLKGHRKNFKGYKKGKDNYRTSFDIFEIDENAYIELYEEYPCQNLQQLRKREGEVIRSLDCVNKRIEGRTKKEYNKQYHANNKEKLNAQCREYNAIHKEKIKARKNQKHNCECGGKYTNSNKAQHLKTKKHQAFINQ